MIELSIYITLAVVFGAIVRVYKSKKSGLFYNLKRDSKNIHPKLKKYHDNIHFISSPSNYYQQFIYFTFIFAICRLLSPELTFINIFISIVSSGLISIGQSTIASYWWQIWINRGSGLPDIDSNENHKSEFAWGNVSFWFSSGKIFNGRKSILLPFIGAIEVLIGLILIYFYIL